MAKNLGIVKALHVGTTAPTNTNMLWRDTSVSPRVHKYYDDVAGQWKSLILDATSILNLLEYLQTSFSQSLDLDRNRIMEHSVAGSINFTQSATTAVSGAKILIILTADGANIPTFDSVFTITYNNYQNTNGIENLVTIQVVKTDLFLVDIRPIS